VFGIGPVVPLVWQSVLALPQEDAELQAKLHHLHMVQWAYLHIWRGEVVKPRELGTFATRQALQVWAREYYLELPAYLAGMSDADLAREVRFDRASASLWPPVRITISGLALAEPGGFDRGTMFQARAIHLDLHVLALLAGRVVVRRLVLDGPALHALLRAAVAPVLVQRQHEQHVAGAHGLALRDAPLGHRRDLRRHQPDPATIGHQHAAHMGLAGVLAQHQPRAHRDGRCNQHDDQYRHRQRTHETHLAHPLLAVGFDRLAPEQRRHLKTGPEMQNGPDKPGRRLAGRRGEAPARREIVAARYCQPPLGEPVSVVPPTTCANWRSSSGCTAFFGSIELRRLPPKRVLRNEVLRVCCILVSVRDTAPGPRRTKEISAADV